MRLMEAGTDRRWMDPIAAGVIYGDDIEQHLDEVHPEDRSLAIATGHCKV